MEDTLAPLILVPLAIVQAVIWSNPEPLVSWGVEIHRIATKIISVQLSALRVLLLTRTGKQLIATLSIFTMISIWNWAKSVTRRARLSDADKAEMKELLRQRAIRVEQMKKKRAESHTCLLCDPKSPKRKLRILTLEGGGIRGVTTGTVLGRILERFPNLLDEVDMICGVSTGSFIAACLATGCTPKEIIRLYDLVRKPCFSNSPKRILFGLKNLCKAKYGHQGRYDSLRSMFGDWNLDSFSHHILVPTLKVGAAEHCYSPYVFTNFGSGISNVSLETKQARLKRVVVEKERREMQIVDLIVRSSAAPTFFPAYHGFVDGGLFANNPTLMGVCQATESGVLIKNISVLSLSTGDMTAPFLMSRDVDWGLAQWAPKLVELLLEANERNVNNICRMLLGSRYHRWTIPFPASLKLDAVEEFDGLVKSGAEVDLTDVFDWIERNWQSS